MKRKAYAIFALASLLVSCSKDSTENGSSATAPEDPSSLPPISSRPLAPASARSTDGETLFQKVAAEQTGIDFVHTWKPGSPYEAALLKTGFTGGGVCLGDYDRDGRCDIFLTRPHGGPELYRNLGYFKFQNVTTTAGLSFPSGLTGGCTFADVDNDGWLDLYVCTYGADNQLFLNQGDGTFQAVSGKARPNHIGAPVKTIFADYDRDGDLDAFIVTNRHEPKGNPKIRYLGTQGNYTVAPEHQEIVGVINLPDRQQFVKGAGFDKLFRNDLDDSGNLTWTDVSEEAGITGNFHGLDAIWWDYNNDHYPDLYIANDFTDPDQFLRNNGDGTFTDISKKSLPHTPWFAMGAATADYDGDGLIDLLATDMSATTHYREKISMGAMDAVAWFLDWAEPRQYMRNALYLNSGGERFMEAAFLAGLASSDWTWSVKAADLDCDGREDVFFTNGFPRDYNNSDFAEELKRTGNKSPNAWLEAPELRERNLAFRNTGGLKFEEAGAKWGVDEEGISFGSALGDLDGDGDLDLVVNHFGEAPGIFRNGSGAAQHRLRVELVGRDGSNRQGIGARVEILLEDGSTQFRHLYPGNGFMSSDEAVVTFGLGTAESVKELTVHWHPSGAEGALSIHENLAADHHYVIAAPSREVIIPVMPATPQPLFVQSDALQGAIHRETPFDDFTVQPLLPNKLSQLGPTMAWGDIDGDGDDDFFLGGAAAQAGQIFKNEAPGKFTRLSSPQLETDATCEDLGSLLADLDNDGDLDLFVVSGGVENSPLQDRLYLNDGSGNFSAAPDGSLPTLTDSGGCVAASDFDKDGDLDLFVGGRCVPGAYPTSPASRLLRNEGGRFTDATDELAPALLEVGMVTDAAWVDIDGDQHADLVLSTEYGTVKTLRNFDGKRLGAPRDISESGWWNTIEPADLDGDGDIDLVVGNLGLNTKYHPSPEKPQVILYGDFSGDGNSAIVEAKPGSDGLLPVRGKSCSSAAMPFLKEKFTTYHDFASASLDQIYTKEKIATSLRLEVTNPESGVLINDGNGGFEFRSLPRLAQISPVRDIATLDFDGDGNTDLFLAQNFYTPQRETGRFAGGIGQLLRGTGDGSFTVVPSQVSGIVASEDSAFATTSDVDLDGKIDLVIAPNDGSVRVFLNDAGSEQ